ncbi:MAG: hypothetical protein CMC14_11985 [Flavobacteriaceae bacterium]|nr:hypothetical protein [Flavobacteriaceae bacterium]|tara:strand:+ start:77962 stop:78882 length:921 start_codon:yes stop_codon:yes gene_type:complete
MISVIIPLYNKERFIGETIQSVLNQSFADFELILINDGSTDKSEAVVKTFNDPRIRYKSIANSGVSVARNTGIELAKFPWIAFLDADDWWAPSFLSEVETAINNNLSKNIFATGRSRVFKNDIERYKNEFLPKDGETSPVNYFRIISKYLPPKNSSNVVIKKELLMERGLFRKGQKQHEDHDLWMRLCVKNEVIFINKPLSFYRKTETDTASNTYYQASDFLTYLTTLAEVENKLNEEEKTYFEGYTNKFIALTYIKNYGLYSKEEDGKVYSKMKQILKGKYLILIKALWLLPYKKTYPIFKFLQR